MNTKEIKKEIRRLRRIVKDLKAEKLRLPAGSKERIELHRKMSEAKKNFQELKNLKKQTIEKENNIEPEKEKLISEILTKDKCLNVLNISLKKYSVEQLKYHLKKLNKGV